jgi:ribosomal protein L9
MGKTQAETKSVVIRKAVWIGGERKTIGTVVDGLPVEDTNLLIGQKSAYEATKENIEKIASEQAPKKGKKEVKS